MADSKGRPVASVLHFGKSGLSRRRRKRKRAGIRCRKKGPVFGRGSKRVGFGHRKKGLFRRRKKGLFGCRSKREGFCRRKKGLFGCRSRRLGFGHRKKWLDFGCRRKRVGFGSRKKERKIVEDMLANIAIVPAGILIIAGILIAAGIVYVYRISCSSRKLEDEDSGHSGRECMPKDQKKIGQAPDGEDDPVTKEDAQTFLRIIELLDQLYS